MGRYCLAANVAMPEIAKTEGILAYAGELSEMFCALHRMGYTGVEFITIHPNQIYLTELQALLKANQLTPVAVNSGRVCGTLGLTLSHPEGSLRKAAVEKMRQLIAFAGIWGIPVNVGIVRGNYLASVDRRQTYEWVVDGLRQLGRYGMECGVSLMIEPVCRGMSNFINTLSQAVQLVQDVCLPNVAVMYDMYQMDLEEQDLYDSIRRYISFCLHVHLADRERAVPGDGKMDFPRIIREIKAAGYAGSYSLEADVGQDAEAAHRRAAEYLIPLLKK